MALDRLTPNGIFVDAASDPPIETLRLARLAAAALRNRGVENPSDHIIVVENDTDTAINLLVSPSPFSAEQVAAIDTWVSANAFEVLHEPLSHRSTRHARTI